MLNPNRPEDESDPLVCGVDEARAYRARVAASLFSSTYVGFFCETPPKAIP
jgi:hypothetical protein